MNVIDEATNALTNRIQATTIEFMLNNIKNIIFPKSDTKIFL